VRSSRGGRAHEQSCGTDPAVGRAVAEERLRLPQCSRVPVRRADTDRGPNPEVAETSSAGIPASRDRNSSGRPSRSAITGPNWGLIGYKNKKEGQSNYTCPLSSRVFCLEFGSVRRRGLIQPRHEPNSARSAL